MLKIEVKKPLTKRLKPVPLGPSGWCPGGVQGVEPLPQPPKKNTEQPPELRAPYRMPRKRRGVVLVLSTLGGGQVRACDLHGQAEGARRFFEVCIVVS